ncbi:hypothetical protein WN51_14282 [Melipona quadrifasciata]|uniref:Uncharacterized protein n=1 Tax=Melipona quadrifasciata TaxID=166423 RepID=A0A0M9A0Z7_9HYME|nr:hypothetical protein WN51_14282 [Melipona quadrifasciata]
MGSYKKLVLQIACLCKCGHQCQQGKQFSDADIMYASNRRSTFSNSFTEHAYEHFHIEQWRSKDYKNKFANVTHWEVQMDSLSKTPWGRLKTKQKLQRCFHFLQVPISLAKYATVHENKIISIRKRSNNYHTNDYIIVIIGTYENELTDKQEQFISVPHSDPGTVTCRPISWFPLEPTANLTGLNCDIDFTALCVKVCCNCKFYMLQVIVACFNAESIKAFLASSTKACIGSKTCRNRDTFRIAENEGQTSEGSNCIRPFGSEKNKQMRRKEVLWWCNESDFKLNLWIGEHVTRQTSSILSIHSLELAK